MVAPQGGFCDLVFVLEPGESPIPSVYLLRNALLIEAHLNSHPPSFDSLSVSSTNLHASFLSTNNLSPGGQLVKYKGHDSKRIEYTLIAVRFWTLYVVGVCPLNA